MDGLSSSQDLTQAQALVDELFNEVVRKEGLLSGGKKLGTGGTAMQGLKETRVTLGNPLNELIKLTRGKFEHVGVELTEIYKLQMREQFDFYHMTMTVSLWPKGGAQFNCLECSLAFGPKGPNEPIVQTIFPESEWKNVLTYGGGLALGLNGNLEWGVGLDEVNLNLLETLPAKAKASVQSKNDLKAFITVPDFCYTLGRNDIVAVGRGTSECRWRIEKPKLLETNTARFIVVFKVPKGTPELHLEGKVIAETSISWLVENLKYVFSELGEQMQALLSLSDDDRSPEERLPIGDHEVWKITLPK